MLCWPWLSHYPIPLGAASWQSKSLKKIIIHQTSIHENIHPSSISIHHLFRYPQSSFQWDSPCDPAMGVAINRAGNREAIRSPRLGHPSLPGCSPRSAHSSVAPPGPSRWAAAPATGWRSPHIHWAAVRFQNGLRLSRNKQGDFRRCSWDLHEI